MVLLLPGGAALLAAVQNDPIGLRGGVVPVEEAVTVEEEEVVRVIKRRVIPPRTLIPALAHMIKYPCKPTTMDMVVHHRRILTIRIIPLQARTHPFQSNQVPIRIIHLMKVRSEAMIEVFVSCISSPFAVPTQDHISQGIVCFPSIPSSPPDAQRISYEIQLRRHLSSPLDCVRAIFKSRMTLCFSTICQDLGAIVESSSSHCRSNSFLVAYCFFVPPSLPSFPLPLSVISPRFLPFRSDQTPSYSQGGFGDHPPPKRPMRRDDKVHDSLIEERIGRERPCRTLFIRNIKVNSSFGETRPKFPLQGVLFLRWRLIGGFVIHTVRNPQ